MTWEAKERQIPQETVIDLREVTADDPESEEDFLAIEDCVSSIIFSSVDDKRELAQRLLDRIMGTPIQVYTMLTPDEIFAYITINHIDDGFFFVRAYPNQKPVIEQTLSVDEAEILEKYRSGA